MIGETVLVGGEPVGNVIVRPGEHLDGTDVSVPAGTVVAYTLAFPADYPGPMHDCKVTVRGHVCDVVGFCDHNRPGDVFGGMWDESLCPWDMLVPVQLCPGDMSVVVCVFEVVVTYDDLGDPVRARDAVYAGAAQARMVSGGESTAPDGSRTAAESWRFVVPWQDAFARLRPEHAEIDFGGGMYDVVSMTNVDMRSEFASFEAVLRNRIEQAAGSGQGAMPTPSA